MPARMNLTQKTAAIIVCFVVGPVAANVASPVFALETSIGVDDSVQKTRAAGAAALEHLRDDDVEKTLESLGAAADEIKNLHPTEDEGLAAATGGLFRALPTRRGLGDWRGLLLVVDYGWARVVLVVANGFGNLGNAV